LKVLYSKKRKFEIEENDRIDSISTDALLSNLINEIEEAEGELRECEIYGVNLTSKYNVQKNEIIKTKSKLKFLNEAFARIQSNKIDNKKKIIKIENSLMFKKKAKIMILKNLEMESNLEDVLFNEMLASQCTKQT